MLETQGKKGFPGGATCQKKLETEETQTGLIPGQGRSPGRWHGKPLQHFLPGESPWKEEPDVLAVHRVTKSWTRLK